MSDLHARLEIEPDPPELFVVYDNTGKRLGEYENFEDAFAKMMDPYDDEEEYLRGGWREDIHATGRDDNDEVEWSSP